MSPPAFDPGLFKALGSQGQSDACEIYGVTATRGDWSKICGVEWYSNTNSPRQTPHNFARNLMAALDSFAVPVDGIRVLSRYASYVRQDAHIYDISSAMRSIKVEVPSNINVWQHMKGEASLRKAAESVSAAVKVLADKISE